MSMANSLEVRSPILDHKVIEFAAQIPPYLKYNRGEKKYVLKHTFQNLLPATILDRKKMGFSVPLAGWLRGELNSFSAHYLFADDSGIRHFFDMEVLRTFWDLHQSGKRDLATVLWTILMFELWYQQFMS
jgi:asparagine synthase (glutamine-hydrolysing)